MFGLKIGDVDLAKRKLYVRRSVGEFGVGSTKTKQSKREVDLSLVSVQALERQIARARTMKAAHEAKGLEWHGSRLYACTHCPMPFEKRRRR